MRVKFQAQKEHEDVRSIQNVDWNVCCEGGYSQQSHRGGTYGRKFQAHQRSYHNTMCQGCWTWSYRIQFFPCRVLVLLWTGTSLLITYSHLWNGNVSSVTVCAVKVFVVLFVCLSLQNLKVNGCLASQKRDRETLDYLRL